MHVIDLIYDANWLWLMHEGASNRPFFFLVMFCTEGPSPLFKTFLAQNNNSKKISRLWFKWPCMIYLAHWIYKERDWNMQMDVDVVKMCVSHKKSYQIYRAPLWKHLAGFVQHLAGHLSGLCCLIVNGRTWTAWRGTKAGQNMSQHVWRLCRG